MGAKRHILIPFHLQERPFLWKVLEGIAADAATRSDWVIHTPYFHLLGRLSEVMTFFPEISGIISGVPNSASLANFKSHPCPIVLMGYSPRPSWASTIHLDYPDLARKAVSHFTDQGITSLASYGTINHFEMGRKALTEGLQEAAREAGISLHQYRPEVKHESGLARKEEQSSRDYLEKVAAWLGGLPPQTGIICGDDEYTDQILLAAHLAGKRVGRDLLVLGCGNDRLFCETRQPQLSSLRLGYRAMGQAAAQELERLMSSAQPECRTVVVRGAEFRLRSSSRCGGSPGSLVQRAVERIWQNVAEIGGVDQLASSCKVSRSTLSRQFKAQRGYGPAEEIRQARVAWALDLIRDSSLSLAEIAQRCHYSDQAHMSRDIRRTTGKSPSGLRASGGVTNCY